MKTGRPVEEIYEDEVDAVVIHGDSIDGLQAWQWDQSTCSLTVAVATHFETIYSLQQEGNSIRENITPTQTRNWWAITIAT